MGMKFLASFVLLAALSTGCGSDGNGTPTAPSPAPSINVPFSATDLRVGTGAEATIGRNVTVRYTLWVYSTTAADNKGNQVDSGNSFPFVVGQGVVPGFSM